MYLSTYPCIHLAIKHTCLFLQPCSYPSFLHSPTQPPTHVPNYSFICLYNCSLIHSLTYSLIIDLLRCIHPSHPHPHTIYLPTWTCPSIYPSIFYASPLKSIYPLTSPSILLSLYSFFKPWLRTYNFHMLEGWKFGLGGAKIKNTSPTLKST